jgi:adenylate cyclase class 1
MTKSVSAGPRRQVVSTDFPREDNVEIVIDALQLRAIKQRFTALNKDRLRRVLESLEPRQRDFIDLLPLLFHINHPMLPGYSSNQTPCGISGFTAARRNIQAARRLAKSFTHQRRAQPRYSIHALYLMGSTGSVAYTRSSDFDIWVCHRPGLSIGERHALQSKTDIIQTWAESLGLEVHFFLMDDVAFRNRDHQETSLSNEHAGSSQHRLLLDEFYRTGMLVAGRFPVWWLVPPEYEANYDKYVRRLIANRFIKSNDIVDFGGLGHLPKEEFLGATLWQLYKAVDSPYKSMLKILLMESYASENSNVDLLAIQFKKAIYRSDIRMSQLDPYIMMCRTVENYLFSQRQLDRLDLARRCFYFKINEPMGTPDRPGNQSWRREIMRELVTDWGWSQARLELLDQRRHWKIQRVTEERNMLVRELTQSYQALSRVGRDINDRHAINAGDLNLLGRKLYVAFERKAGKIELINPGISEDLSEERMSLHRIEDGQKQYWAIFQGSIPANEIGEHVPLKRTTGLLELLAWCHFNRLVSRNPSIIGIYPSDGELTQWELRCVLDCLQQLFPDGNRPETDMQALADEACIRRGGLFINLAHDPMAKLSRNGMQLVSERIDPLSYGGQWENLAATLEMITTTSWGEVLTFRYRGQTALLSWLCDCYSWAPVNSGRTPPSIRCFSFSSSRGAIIAKRLEELHREITDFFYNNYWRRHARYALRIGQQYYVLQCENDIPRYRELDSYAALLNYLGQPQAAFSPISVDRQAFSDSPLPLLLEHNQEGVVQLFFQVQGRRARVYILDEQGSLFHQLATFYDYRTLLGNYQTFLDNVHYRMRSMGAASHLAINEETQYFEIVRDHQEALRLEAVRNQLPNSNRRFLDVQVIGSPGDDNEDAFSVYCGEQEFSSLQYGADVFTQAAQHIILRRQSGDSYPIYITDIDLSPLILGADSTGKLQTIHFLRQKKRTEQLLNNALAGERQSNARN